MKLAFFSRWYALALPLALLPFTFLFADEFDKPTLFLSQGQYVEGAFEGSSGDNEIRWSHPAFDGPLTVDVKDLRRITAWRASVYSSSFRWAFHLVGGDILHGKLVAANEKSLAIETSSFGKIEVPAESLIRMLQVETVGDVGGRITLPAFLRDVDKVKKYGWSIEGNHLVTGKRGAEWPMSSPHADRFRVELRLGWNDDPNFEIAFSDSAGLVEPESPRLEVWEKTVVALQQIGSRCELTKLWDIGDNEKDISLTIFVNRNRESISVYTNTGSYLGRIRVKFDDLQQLNRVSVINHGKNLAIDSVTISEWDGKEPYAENVPGSGGYAWKEIVGSIIELTPDGESLRYRDSSGVVTTRRLDDFNGFHRHMDRKEVRRLKSIDPSPSAVQVDFFDLTQVSGVLKKAEPGKIAIAYRQGLFTIVGDAADVVRITTLHPVDSNSTATPQRMRLSMKGVELYGRLVDTFECREGAKLAFQPFVSPQPITLREDSQGRLADDRPTVDPQTTVWRAMLQNGRIADDETKSAASPYRTPEDLQLRSGDVFDAEIESIDEKGVSFRSPITEKTFLPNEVVRSVQLKNPMRGVTIDDKKMERLLTVPRLQKERPPTHLLVTTQGDYIRGRLMRLTETSAEIEDGSKPLTIPRQLISVIVWLYERTWEETQPETSVLDPNTFYLHVEGKTGNRFTVSPKRFADGKFYADSPLLGEVSVPMTQSVTFGKNMQSTLASKQQNPWRLALAKQPLVFQEGDEAGNQESTMSRSDLVGKPAPNFELNALDGTPWRLGDQKGKVVVLDFWASWCGPCIRAMPLVEGTIRELNREDCLWVGVNIEESDIRARSVVERLQLQGLVVLDELGGVAQEYGATAIPMVVVVDKKGTVRSVFVGSEEQNLVELKKTIEACLSEAL